MKHIRLFLSGIVAVIAIMIAVPTSNAQDYDMKEFRKAVATEMRKQLPMEVSKGMTWTKIDLSNETDVMTWTFLINPTEMGTTLKAAKTEINGLTTAQFKSLLGNEFDEVIEMFKCDILIKLVFPDKSTKNFLINK